jgi:CPA2 family monovalent cation:H+ antiporter-2
MPQFAVAADTSLVFVELGCCVAGLALLARLAGRWGISTIPLYLLGGLAFGNGGLVPLRFSEEVVHVGGEIGVVLLLFMLGLEYSGDELRTNLKKGLPSGCVDFALNFPPGVAAGFLLGWHWLAAVLLGGVTWVSSSGIVAKVVGELRWTANRETPAILAVLVLEDLAMALYLPLVAVLLVGREPAAAACAVLVALGSASTILFVAIRYGAALSRWLLHDSDEVILLSTFGIVLLVAGICERVQVSAAVGAFLVGIALSGPVVPKAHVLIGPLRDLFAAMFFLFFGLQINPAELVPVLVPAALLGVVTGGTKFLTGWLAARRAGAGAAGRWRAGAALVSRGEFSVVIAGLGAPLEPRLGTLAAAYVLLMAVAGPVLTRVVAAAVPEPSATAATEENGFGTLDTQGRAH